MLEFFSASIIPIIIIVALGAIILLIAIPVLSGSDEQERRLIKAKRGLIVLLGIMVLAIIIGIAFKNSRHSQPSAVFDNSRSESIREQQIEHSKIIETLPDIVIPTMKTPEERRESIDTITDWRSLTNDE